MCYVILSLSVVSSLLIYAMIYGFCKLHDYRKDYNNVLGASLSLMIIVGFGGFGLWCCEGQHSEGPIEYVEVTKIFQDKEIAIVFLKDKYCPQMQFEKAKDLEIISSGNAKFCRDTYFNHYGVKKNKYVYMIDTSLENK